MPGGLWLPQQPIFAKKKSTLAIRLSQKLKVERLDPKTLFPQRKSCNALGTTRSTLFAAMFLGEKFDCIVTPKP